MQTTYHDKWMISKATEKFSGFATLAGAAFGLAIRLLHTFFGRGAKQRWRLSKIIDRQTNRITIVVKKSGPRLHSGFGASR